MVMRGQNWDDVETIKHEMTRQLRSLTSEDVEECFNQWKRRWDKCIATDGEYFEENKIDI